jgi:filamentous hemagglutinin family protein
MQMNVKPPFRLRSLAAAVNSVFDISSAGLVSGLIVGSILSPAVAGPENGVVQAGTANISTGSNLTYIDQESARAVIDWQSFSIDSNETVHFRHQAGQNSATLNRVTGGSQSLIDGILSAHSCVGPCEDGVTARSGAIWIVNPNGIVFNGNAHVNVGSLVASTLDVDSEDFQNGLTLTLVDGGSAGSISIADGAKILIQDLASSEDLGVAAFVAPTISNSGLVRANLGRIEFGAGTAFTYDFLATVCLP